jgi:glycosyltransferase involved in cell wall biosynthesis
MKIMFLSDRKDDLLETLYEYFSKMYPCEYGMNTTEADLFVANCITNFPNKTIYYATDPSDYLSDISTRRFKIGFFQKTRSILCPSLYLAQTFYRRFKIPCEIQYPHYLTKETSPQNIICHPKFASQHSIDVNELSHENLKLLDGNLSHAKLYISNDGPIDGSLIEASARGVPVIAPNDVWVQEFLINGDQTFRWGTTEWIAATKKCLRNIGSKVPSGKYSNMSTLHDKIQKALEKKPTVLLDFQPKPVKPPQVFGRRPNRTTRVEPRRPIMLPEISDRTIYISGSCIGISGYDNLVYETIRGFKSIGADVRINANNQINYNVCPVWFQDIHAAKPANAWEIIITPPCNLNFITPGKRSVVLTMWETDYLEPEWVKMLNNAHMVCVPSQWAVECFKKCGVTVPIACVPLGYDPLIFNPLGEFPKLCTFGTAAALTAGGLRKNTRYIIDLFRKAFPEEADVRLKVKVSPACPLPEFQDSRVEIIREMLPPAKLADWYRSITAFVNASYAEGFGLHLIESMACGRPLISTYYSAVTEYFDDSVGWTVDHEIIKAAGGAYSGHWGKPIEQSIINNMRQVYSDKEAVKNKGEAAYLKSRDFTWKKFGHKLIEAIGKNGVVNL